MTAAMTGRLVEGKHRRPSPSTRIDMVVLRISTMNPDTLDLESLERRYIRELVAAFSDHVERSREHHDYADHVGQRHVGPVQAVHDRLDDLEHREGGDAEAD